MNITIPKLLAMFLCLNGVVYADSPDTNELYMPETNERVSYQTEKANWELNEQIKIDAIKTGECRPAQFDTDGNWGIVTVGFQMSIRSATNVFIVGTNMPIAVILRNVTTNTLSRLSIERGFSDGGEILLSVEDQSGHIRDNEPAGVEGVEFKDVAAKHQVKHLYNLNAEFHLSPGSYKIFASQMVRGQSLQTGKPIFSKVSSGILTVKVVPQMNSN